MTRRHRIAFLFLASIFALHLSFTQTRPMLMSPYLQAVTTNSIYVMVESLLTDSVIVEYGVSDSYGKKAATESFEVTTHYTFVHRIKLSNLSPNTEYHYRALQSGQKSADATFRTAPKPGAGFRFAWMADCRTGTGVHDSIAMLIDEAHPVMSLYGGDLCANSSYAAFKDQFFLPNELALIARVPFFNTPGNHEKWSQNTEAFTQAPASSSGTQDYYSFDYGDVHILVLNNEIADSVETSQFRFAESDLSASTRPWKVVICHKPPYCAGGHGEDRDMKTMAEKVFEPNHVDVVISGHSHFFQHNLVNGIHYMVLGSAGAPFYTPKTAPYTVKTAKEYNYGIVDVSPTSFRMMVYNERGLPLDTLALTKGGSVKSRKPGAPEGLLVPSFNPNRSETSMITGPGSPSHSKGIVE
jgi:predicted phosphodiesterase